MSDYITKTCAICGKEIVIRSTESWAYKVPNGAGYYWFFCRYTHMQTWKRQHPQKSDQERFEEFAAAYGVSVREREVLRLVLAERTNAEVAGELFITEGTVKYHVHNLLKKTGCNSRLELIEKFNRETR